MSDPKPVILPPQRSALAGVAPCTDEWYVFFRLVVRRLRETGVDPSVIADIEARLAALEASGCADLLLQGLLSVEVSGSPTGGLVQLSLVADEAAPASTHYYGTAPTGQKGYHPIADTVDAVSDELTKAVDPDGVTSFGLADVPDAGGGTLQRTQFDAKGRKTGTSPATTDDLDEGATNAYFTAERAQDAVGNSLLDTATVNLTYNDTTGQISADASLMTWGGVAGVSPPPAGVKIISQNNTQPQLFEVITTGAGTTFGADICSTAYEDVGGGGVMHVRRARGTLAAPSGLLSGDIVGGISGRAYHSGGAFQNSGPASIHWVASEDQTASAFGSYMRFYTTPKGSTTRVERLVITDVGAIWSLGTGTFDPKSASQTQPFGGTSIRYLASAVGEAARFAAISYGGGGNGGQINLASAGGTAAAPTSVATGTPLGLITGIGYSGAAWIASALMRIETTENWTASANGTDYVFEATPNGSTTRFERLRIKGDGRIFGTALHNNANPVTGTTEQYIASGTWTPTLTNLTNITSSTASVCQWNRVGNVVNFSGRVTIDPAAVGLIQLGMSPPIASNFVAVEQAGGTGASNNEFFRVYADTTNDRLMIESIIKADVASAGFHFSGSYLIAS